MVRNINTMNQTTTSSNSLIQDSQFSALQDAARIKRGLTVLSGPGSVFGNGGPNQTGQSVLTHDNMIASIGIVKDVL